MPPKKLPIKIDGRKLTLSNVDKVLYPQSGFTKGQMIEYYRRIAPVLIPHLKNRPLTLKRFPNGVREEFFYEKRCPSFRPDWILTRQVGESSRAEPPNYCVVNDAAALIWVANLASIELHTMLFTIEKINVPTFMVFDLDPGAPADIINCAEIAIHMRDMLQNLKLQSFPKTSGGKGLHFYVPLNTPASFDQTKTFSRAVARTMEQAFPDRVVSKMSKSLRPGKVFIDWSQNDSHKTTVVAYSLRARERPTVSTPLTWKELERAYDKKDAGLLHFEWDDVLRRVEKTGDLFAEVLTLKQSLPAIKI